jgi:hypothetical protein
MKRLSSLVLAIFGLTVVSGIYAADQDKKAIEKKIKNAESAAPHSVAAKATIMDWPAKEGGESVTLRKGTNGWTCFPDMPSTKGNDPMCLDAQWMEWADAWMHKRDPKITGLGIGYMLQENAEESNTDPFATKATADNEWMKGVPHVMLLVPDAKMLDGMPVHPDQGGPWVMWRNTPYVHVMAPMPPGMIKKQ